MLYCQPQSFYDEMKYVSDNNKAFIQNISLPIYKLPENMDFIEPISFFMAMAKQEPAWTTEQIFSIRTYGHYNALEPDEKVAQVNVYYAMLHFGFLLITRPSVSYVTANDDGLLYITEDSYGDTFGYSIEDIANSDGSDYALLSYVKYNEDVFRPSNLLAKIPSFLL